MREAVGRLRDDAVACATASPAALPADEAEDCIVALHEAVQALTALQTRLLHQLDAAPRRKAAWLRDRLRVDWHIAREMAAQGALLEQRPALDEALSTGQVTGAQVRVIGEALRFLPDEAGPAVVDEAELALLDHARHLEPARLRRVGDRILQHVAPEVAERLEGEALRKAEQRAWWRRGLTLQPPVAGSVRLTGCLTVEDAAIVQSALEPLCAPSAERRPGRRGPAQESAAQHSQEEERSPRQRRADALVEICKLALRSGGLPDHGGQPPQLTVTIDYETLISGLGVAYAENGARLDAETARRLACEARILPVVLDGAGQPLDLGRGQRFFTTAQRQALAVRDGGCAFPDCDRPARWCEAHHMVPWDKGGPTDVADGVLLCRPHHRLFHGGGWEARRGPDGAPELVPPAHVDPMRRPRSGCVPKRSAGKAGKKRTCRSP